MNLLFGLAFILSALIGIGQLIFTGCLFFKGLGKRCGGELLEPTIVLSVLFVFGIYIIYTELNKKRIKQDKDSENK
jgi:undecaprenyl pyrophosphate phosphatase UppP